LKRILLPTYRLVKQLWTVSASAPSGGDYGSVSYEKKLMLVRERGRTRDERVATAVHEAIHVAYPFLSEEAVLAGELAVMKSLRAYGLLLKDDDDG
jgi:hypothetical protein